VLPRSILHKYALLSHLGMPSASGLVRAATDHTTKETTMERIARTLKALTVCLLLATIQVLPAAAASGTGGQADATNVQGRAASLTCDAAAFMDPSDGCLSEYFNLGAATAAAIVTAAALATCLLQPGAPATCWIEDLAHVGSLAWVASAQLALNECLGGGGEEPPLPEPE